MLEQRMTMLILSCDKYSDLWPGQIKLLDTNWPDREMKTYIVTDRESEQKFDSVGIIVAGADLEWSERLAAALSKVDTPYVFITLDDYYLTRRVSTDAISGLADLMEKESIDYIRMYPRPKRATRDKIKGYKKIRWFDVSSTYGVNLYPAVWKRDFLEYTLSKKLNAWQFEVSLTQSAVAYGAKGAVSANREYRILDVVRKGKILHSANAYFKKHPGIYEGDRELQTWSFEIRLQIQMMISRHTRGKLKQIIKSFMRKRGYKFYSDYTESERSGEEK
ncbi:MAG: hypothetical protein J5933_01660 [Clostridia bacterium]|nr:hypothetical protein [Clostridia bacterium]